MSERSTTGFEPAAKAVEILDTINGLHWNEERGFRRQYIDGMGQRWGLRALTGNPRSRHVFLERNVDYDNRLGFSLRHTFTIGTEVAVAPPGLHNIRVSSWLGVSLVELGESGQELVTPISKPKPLEVPVEIDGILINKHLDRFSDVQQLAAWSGHLQGILEASTPLIQ